MIMVSSVWTTVGGVAFFESKIIEDELDAVRKIGAPVHRLVGVPSPIEYDEESLRKRDGEE